MATRRGQVISIRDTAAPAESARNVAPTRAPLADPAPKEQRKDYFIEKDGLNYAGTHLIIDLWDAERLDDLPHVEQALRDAVTAAKATLLAIKLHHFSENGGISGVVILAESHISIHTWPERGYAALDIFMCGSANPADAIPVLKAAFKPRHISIAELKRGIL